MKNVYLLCAVLFGLTTIFLTKKMAKDHAQPATIQTTNSPELCVLQEILAVEKQVKADEETKTAKNHQYGEAIKGVLEQWVNATNKATINRGLNHKMFIENLDQIDDTKCPAKFRLKWNQYRRDYKNDLSLVSGAIEAAAAVKRLMAFENPNLPPSVKDWDELQEIASDYGVVFTSY